MLPLYQRIWELAKPYYEKGRPMDVNHIIWMMQIVEKICKSEDIDESILMPLAILHDVGYSELTDSAHANYYDTDIRKAHMKAGALIARRILDSVSYPPDKTDRIVQYVAVHDNWAYGEVDMYIQDKLLGTFKDLDYLWLYTAEGCRSIQPILKKNNVEMLAHLHNEQTPIHNKKPFSTEFTRKLRETYLQERIIELVSA